MIRFFKSLLICFVSSTMTVGETCAQADATVDRTTCFAPMLKHPHDAGDTRPPKNNRQQTPASALSSEPWAGGLANAWQQYVRLWQAHTETPDDRSIRRYFGLPLSTGGNGHDWKLRRSRSAPPWLNWRSGTYQQINTNHFTIYTQADRETSQTIAATLEHCYWVWTQMFFPFWEGTPQIKKHLAEISPGLSPSEFLAQSSNRLSIRRRMNVVVFRDAQQYRKALGAGQPGVQASTGFYSNDRRTTFLIGDASNDATLRHELVHQLFREATLRKSRRTQTAMPGEQRDFWLVEGIAGYFESMVIQPNGQVTLGGWDAPRLQYARYRVLVGGDNMPLEEVRRDGRLAAQSRSDLPRWYAHAIARTHHLMDSGETGSRYWIYQKLAELYGIPMPGKSKSGPPQTTHTLQEFLTISDSDIRANSPTRSLQELCLARCEVTRDGIGLLPPSNQMRWLDLSGLPVTTSDVARLVPNPEFLERLNLEATQADQELANWFKLTSLLSEIDLSWTKCSDDVVMSLRRNPKLSTLWLTGAPVTDASIEFLVKMKALKNIDVQRTGISEGGLSQLSTRHPALNINPLQLIAP